MNDSITAQAEATKAVAGTTGKAIELAGKAGNFWAKVFGEVPQDLVGLLGGDYLRHARHRNLERLGRETDRILSSRGITSPKEVSASLAIPLLTAAEDENNDELRKLWTNLLANAMDPGRPDLLRHKLIDTLKQFNPLDAMILRELGKIQGAYHTQVENHLMRILEIDHNSLVVSLEVLEDLKCIYYSASVPNIRALGTELLRACSA